MSAIPLYYLSVREHFAIMLASPVTICKLDWPSRQVAVRCTFRDRCALVTAKNNGFAEVDTAFDHSLGRQRACKLATTRFC